jgi:hypothetical protein
MALRTPGGAFPLVRLGNAAMRVKCQFTSDKSQTRLKFQDSNLSTDACHLFGICYLEIVALARGRRVPAPSRSGLGRRRFTDPVAREVFATSRFWISRSPAESEEPAGHAVVMRERKDCKQRSFGSCDIAHTSRVASIAGQQPAETASAAQKFPTRPLGRTRDSRWGKVASPICLTT